jgi:hypothetical protein
MWTVSSISTKQRKFDFSSSEQGRPVYTSLIFDGEVVINMIELVGSGDDATYQFLICEDCGITHCEPGNWVSIRQGGDFIVFMPAYGSMLAEPTSNEYQPPYFFNTRGSVLLTETQFQEIQRMVPAFAEMDNISHLTGFEAACLYREEAPFHIFNKFPEFRQLTGNDIVEFDDTDNESITSVIENNLTEIAAANKIQIVKIASKDRPVSLTLKNNPQKGWKAFCETETGMELIIGEEYKFVIE